MITDVILSIFVSLADFIVGMLPSIDLDISNNWIVSVASVASQLFEHVGYFLPVDTLLSIFGFVLVLDNLELLTKIVYRIKSFIPTMGK